MHTYQDCSKSGKGPKMSTLNSENHNSKVQQINSEVRYLDISKMCIKKSICTILMQLFLLFFNYKALDMEFLW